MNGRKVLLACGFAIWVGFWSSAARAEKVAVSASEVAHFAEVVLTLRGYLNEQGRRLETAEHVRNFRRISEGIRAYKAAIDVAYGSDGSQSRFGQYLVAAEPWAARNLGIAEGEKNTVTGMFAVLDQHTDAQIAGSPELLGVLAQAAGTILGTGGFERAQEPPQPPDAELEGAELAGAVDIASLGLVLWSRDFVATQGGAGVLQLGKRVAWLVGFLRRPAVQTVLADRARVSRYARAAESLIGDAEAVGFLEKLDSLVALHGFGARAEIAWTKSGHPTRLTPSAPALVPSEPFTAEESDVLRKLSGSFILALPTLVDGVAWQRPDVHEQLAYRRVAAAASTAHAFLRFLGTHANNNYLAASFHQRDYEGTEALMNLATLDQGETDLAAFKRFLAEKDREKIVRSARRLADAIPRNLPPRAVKENWQGLAAVTDHPTTENYGITVLATSFAVIAQRLKGAGVNEAAFAARQVQLLEDAFVALTKRRDAAQAFAVTVATKPVVGSREFQLGMQLLREPEATLLALRRIRRSFELQSGSGVENAELSFRGTVKALETLVVGGSAGESIFTCADGLFDAVY